MEERKIVVVSTRSQKKSVIMSSATTLAELKSDLDKANIEYADMTFYEGLSKTELKDDASVLPHDVPYKGTTTNELVFMLTNPSKKIRSGAGSDRIALYNRIKEMGLQEECVRVYGKNVTNCKTADLIALIEKNTVIPMAEAPANDEEAMAVTSAGSSEVVDVKARQAILQLVDALECNFISNSSADHIRETLGEEGHSCEECCQGVASSYSDDEIDDMFDFV